MARPKNTRMIQGRARTRYFRSCSEIALGEPVQSVALEEYEAIRLSDYEGLSQTEAAAFMGVSRHTYGRILTSARKKLALSLVFGQTIEVTGGTYQVVSTVQKTKQEKEHMRIAISSQGPQMTDMVDGRFGRAAGFIIYDTETRTVEYIDNGAAQVAAQGAGLMAAEAVSAAKAAVVLSGYVGPKAMTALQAAQIEVVQEMDNQTVQEAVDAYLSR